MAPNTFPEGLYFPLLCYHSLLLTTQRSIVLATLQGTVIKYLTKLRKREDLYVHRSRETVYHAGKTGQQEPDETDHMLPQLEIKMWTRFSTAMKIQVPYSFHVAHFLSQGSASKVSTGFPNSASSLD